MESHSRTGKEAKRKGSSQGQPPRLGEDEEREKRKRRRGGGEEDLEGGGFRISWIISFSLSTFSVR